MQNIFYYDDYKKYLRDWIKKKNKEVRGVQSRLAEFLNCHTTHITLILKHNNHLSLEQASRFSKFANQSEDETLFFQLLLHYSRAADSQTREIYEKELKKKIQDKLDKSIQTQVHESLSEEAKSVYYGSWIYSAVHMAVTIPSLQYREKIVKELGVSHDLVDEALEFLCQTGLILKEKEKYLPGNKTIHLTRHSRFGFQQHINWRLRAIEDLNRGNKIPFHYTSVVSMSLKDEAKVRQILQEAVNRSRELVSESKEEALFVIGIDWFPIGKSEN